MAADGKACKNTNAQNSNAWLAWGPVAVRALHADHHTLGWSASTLNNYRYRCAGGKQGRQVFRPRQCLPACLPACHACLLVAECGGRPLRPAPPRAACSAGNSWPPELRRAYWPRMADFWQRADALDASSRFALRTWSPQVVVLAGGTNVRARCGGALFTMHRLHMHTTALQHQRQLSLCLRPCALASQRQH